ncbi:putative deaminase of polymorphic toxin system [Haloactinospora alba]|uniref:Putative deaminase of polymorphic toxin system n=1 Tax=Haloactinospora alba TaxID=405555 RepID=A0A543N7M0_9ACTN|nr:polymorphic toxin-type HINT domain-containing protein [Haloactinospora alba]TQN27824.1 putative deaminase of polymorphic toxin system [Haloactinospora alba]
MLRRLHDPDRGASLLEYGAVVVLCAAILTALVQSGLVTTISSGVQSATDSLFSPGDSQGTGTSDTDPDSDPDGADPGSGQDDASEDGSDSPELSHEDGNSGRDDESGQEDGSGQDSGGGEDEGGSDSSGGDDSDGGGGGGDGHNAAPANNDSGSDWNLPDMPDMDDVQEQGGRFLDGAEQAGENAVEDFQESADDLGQLIDDVRDDPVQAAQDRYEQGREDVENIRDAAEDDPLGLARDMLASDEAQEHCRNGRYAECGGMIAGENLSAGIPILGWDKKRQRLEALADSAGNNRGRGDNDSGNSQDEESETRAEGAPSPPGDSSTDSRRDDENDDGEEDSDGSGASCSINSFLPATPVVLADGSRVAISEVEAGDAVWAFDPRTGEEGPRRVTDTISSAGDKQLVDVTVQDEDGGSRTLTATQEHPFWAPQAGEWVEAGELRVGTWLRTSSGTWVQVQALQAYSASGQPVHNLTVEGLHTYYVGAGQADALVHNDDEECLNDGNSVEVPAGPEAVSHWREKWEWTSRTKMRKNVAVADVDLEGVSSQQYVGVSGNQNPEGASTLPQNPRYNNVPDPPRADGSEGNQRALDSERKILERVAENINPRNDDGSYQSPRPDIEGTINLHTELPQCRSCQSVTREFKEEFPNVEIVVTDGR